MRGSNCKSVANVVETAASSFNIFTKCSHIAYKRMQEMGIHDFHV